MADLTISAGQTKPGALHLFDAVTSNEINGVVYSNKSIVSNSNPSSCGFSVTPPGSQINYTGIAPGTGQVVIQADVAYTDPGSGQPVSETKQITKNFTVTPSAHGANLDFS